MTKLEKEALLTLANRLKDLASLERAGFSFDKDEDEKIKKAIKCYMHWFEGVAFEIEKIVELEDKPHYLKKYELNDIIHYNR